MSVNGDLFYEPTADAGIRVGGTTGSYPAWEVNHYAPDGTATAALQRLPVANDPLALLLPNRGVGDLQLPYELNNVFPALPGMGPGTGRHSTVLPKGRSVAGGVHR